MDLFASTRGALAVPDQLPRGAGWTTTAQTTSSQSPPAAAAPRNPLAADSDDHAGAVDARPLNAAGMQDYMQAQKKEIAERKSVIDGMLKAGGSQIAPKDQGEIEQHLQQVPLDVLKTVSKSGTRIAVMGPDQTPEDVGIVANTHDNTALDSPALQKQYRDVGDNAFAASDHKYGSQIADLQGQLTKAQDAAQKKYDAAHKDDKPAPATPAPAAGFGMLGIGSLAAAQQLNAKTDALNTPEVQDLTKKLGTLQGQSAVEAMTQIHDKTDGKIQIYTRPLTGDLLADNLISDQPVTLDSIAEQHGARTPEEKKQYTSQVQALNGERLDQMQAEYLKKLSPDAHAGDGIPKEQRPFDPDVKLLVPNYNYYRKSDDPQEKPRIINGHDMQSLRDWKSGNTVGEYYESNNTILFKSGHLDKNSEGSDTTVHELGHAYMSALRKNDPDFAKTFDTQWSAHFDDNSKHPDRFATNYASANADESFAEDFSAWHSGRRNLVTDRDHDGATLMQQALDESHKLASR